MYSVAQALTAGFGRSWHESVAIVQEAATLLQPGIALPAPEDLLLDENGTLSFGFGSESSDHPVTALASLLQDLLEGVEAPAGLRDIAAENATPDPAHASVDGFARALAFYERPNRASDLRALAGRLGASRDKSSADQEFARLREKVSGSPTHPKEEDEKKEQQASKPRPRLTKGQRQVVAGGIAAGLVLGLLTVQSRGNPGFSLSGVVASVDSGITSAVSAGLSRLGASTPTSAAPKASEPVEMPAKDKPAARPSTRTVASAVPTSGFRPGPAPSTSRRETRRPDGPVVLRPEASPPSHGAPVAPVPIPEVPAAFEPSAVVYTPADDNVDPPSLVRPQMPQEPKPGQDTGYFDLLVDESGTVERVKLISPTRRYQERMLVAAAKAWKFRPATLDGEPVKYRVLIPIILPGLP